MKDVWGDDREAISNGMKRNAVNTDSPEALSWLMTRDSSGRVTQCGAKLDEHTVYGLGPRTARPAPPAYWEASEATRAPTPAKC